MRLTTTSYPTVTYTYPSSSNVLLSYLASNVAPHSTTTRASYTVPANRMVTVMGFSVMMQRVITSTQPLITSVIVQVSPDGSSWSTIVRYDVNMPGVHNVETLTLPVTIHLTEGWQIRLQTYDGSVGGECSYSATVIGIEYSST